MQIDWVTVAAQIVNFLVLVWLLQWVLYRPLTRALEAREEEVGRSLREAEVARRSADAEALAHRTALQELEATRQSRLAAADKEAEAMRATLTEQARGEVAGRRAAWQAQLDGEKAAFLDSLRRRAGEAFVTLARRALADMADEDLLDRLAHMLARRLAALEPEAKEQLRSAVTHGDRPRILSSFPLSGEAQASIKAALEAEIGQVVTIDLGLDPDLTCGVVLAIGSRRVGWTLAEHLDMLEEEVGRVLEGRASAEEAA